MKKIFALGLACMLFLCFAGFAQADVVLSEGFESGMPGDWTVIDGQWGSGPEPDNPDGVTWIVTSGVANTSVEYNIYVDQLITPILDCSNFTDVTLTFDHIVAPMNYCGSVFVDLRIDGGSWQNLVTYTYPDDVDETKVIDISSYADEQSSVEVRWYNEAITDAGWFVDNVEITGTPESAPPVPLPFSEDFESGMPGDWTVIDGQWGSGPEPDNPDGVTWVVTSGVANTSVEYNIYVDQLITPILDCSGFSDVTLTFDHIVAPMNYCGSVFVDLRIDGGSWQNLVTYTYPDDVDETKVIDISSYADDQTSVEVRWYNEAITDAGWFVDNVEVAGSTFEHVGEGGPDIFGNIWKDNTVEGGPTFNYIDISGSRAVIGNGDDTGFGPFPIGFSFPFYGTAYSEFNVNTNGLITMTASTGTRSNYCPVPDEGAADFWIAPFWDDLNVRSDDGGNIYYQYFDAEIDYLVIQWHNFSIYGEYGDPMDMEVILYSNGNILFQYDYINALEDGQGQAATVGIEQDINDGLTYLCNDDVPGNRLYSGLAIGWYPPVINHDVGVVSIDDPAAPLVVTGAAVDVTATVSNYGINPETFDVGLEVKNSSDVVVFTDTENITVTVGNSGQVAFDSWTVGDADDYSITVTTLLSGDESAENDELASSITAVGVVSMPVNQDFEGVFPPEEWTVLDFGGESSWTTNTNHYHSPTHSAQASYDWMADTDDWLVMAPIDMSDGGNINWQYYEEDSQYNPFSENGLRHSFYVCTDIYFDPASLTPFVVHTPADHVIPDFNGDPIEFDLSAYAGNSHVWLAFRQENSQGPNTEYWWIDDVSVSSALTNDVGVYSIDLPVSFIIENCDAPVEVTVKNYGLATQTFDVNVTITGDVLGEVYNQTVGVFDLAYGASEAVPFPDFTEPQADSYTINSATLLQSDENISNDALSGETYVNTTIIHAWDDDEADGDMTPYPFDNTMLAVKYTPLATDFTILGGYVYVNNYNPDGNSYAEFEWVKICPDVAGAPDLDNPYGTLDNVGVYTVPILIPIDIPDVVVADYTGDIWIVVKYWDDASEWLCMAIDTDDPDGYSYYNMYSDPPVWQQVTDRDYMMRIEVEYEPCIPAVGSIGGTVTDVFSRNPVGGATVNAWQDGGIVAYTTTETDGTYLLADLNTGLYDVEFIADGYYDYTETGVLVESGALTTLDVVLHKPGSYGGVVSDFYGTPLDGVHVIATEFISTMPLFEDFEDGFGDFVVVDGSWDSGAQPDTPDGITWVIENGAATTNVPYQIYVDQLITPVLDCTDWTGVSLSFDHIVEPLEWCGIVYIDIRIDGGSWTNLLSYTYPDAIDDTENIDISSYADGQSSVEVRWYNEAITDAGWTVDNVNVTGSGPVALDWSEVVDVYTADGGQYTLILDPDKVYDIEYSMAGYVTQTVLGVDLDVDQIVDDADITLILMVGSISGTVTDVFSRNPVGGAEVNAWQDGGIVASTTTETNGTYLLADLATGLYDVEFIADGYYDYTETGVEVLTDQATILDVVLHMPGSYGGVVLDFYGTPLDGVHVIATEFIPSMPLSEDFEDGMPENWTVIDGSTWSSPPGPPDGFTWEVVGGAAVSVNDGYDPQNDMLITPVLDCTDWTGVSLSYDHSIEPWEYSGYGLVDIRIDGGEWTNLATYEYPDNVNETENIDISSYADGHSSVEIRWHNYSISENGWTVDNVSVTGSGPVALDWSEVVDVYTADGGQYTLILDPDKVYDIEYSMTDWFTQTVLGVDLDVDQIVDDADITLRRYGTLSGIVDDGTNPIQDVHVTVDDGSRVIIGEADTDVNGFYTIGDIPDGVYTVTFTHVDYEELIVSDHHIYENPPENILDAELSTFGYEYVPGDCNMALGLWPPTVIGGDVSYLVGYFIGSGNLPCYLDDFWASADVTGDCQVIGGDVSALVGYFIGTVPAVGWCGDDPEDPMSYPPAWLEGVPDNAPAGWPNCDVPVLNDLKIIPTDTDK